MILGIGAVVLLAGFFVGYPRAQSPFGQAPDFVSGWRVGLPREDLGDSQAPRESTCRPGELAFVPAGALFTVEAEPEGASGELLRPENDAWSWRQPRHRSR